MAKPQTSDEGVILVVGFVGFLFRSTVSTHRNIALGFDLENDHVNNLLVMV